MVLIVSLGFLASCGSSSSNGDINSESGDQYDIGVALGSATLDAGTASGSATLGLDDDVIIIALDSGSKRELARTKIFKGTSFLDEGSNVIDEEVTFELNATSHIRHCPIIVDTNVTMSAATEDGKHVDTMSADLDLNVTSPMLKGMCDRKAIEAYYAIEDVTSISPLNWKQLMINRDGNVDVTVTYKEGRKWHIMWIFNCCECEGDIVTGATGATGATGGVGF